MRTAPAVFLAALVLSGCQEVATDTPEARAELKVALEAYLPKLGEAYAKLDAKVLQGFAAEKEIASIDRLIDQLKERGEYIVPEIVETTIEEVTLWRRANAYVTTLEVWNLRRHATGSHAQLQEYLGQRDRVKYQLKREGDRWIVLFRQVVDRDL